MEIKQSIEIVIKKELNAQKELRPYVNQKKAKNAIEEFAVNISIVLN